MALQSCNTTFLQQAQSTPGMDYLVQAIQRGNLVLPAAGSGVTSFAPNNAAFTDFLRTQSELWSAHHVLQGLSHSLDIWKENCNSLSSVINIWSLPVSCCLRAEQDCLS